MKEFSFMLYLFVLLFHDLMKFWKYNSKQQQKNIQDTICASVFAILPDRKHSNYIILSIWVVDTCVSIYKSVYAHRLSSQNVCTFQPLLI